MSETLIGLDHVSLGAKQSASSPPLHVILALQDEVTDPVGVFNPLLKKGLL